MCAGKVVWIHCSPFEQAKLDCAFDCDERGLVDILPALKGEDSRALGY